MTERDWHGRFICKSDDYRHVRAIRVTDRVWDEFGEMSNQRSITRADLLEEMVEENYNSADLNQVIMILKEALKLKANAGGAIKKRIREVLLILQRE